MLLSWLIGEGVNDVHQAGADQSDVIVGLLPPDHLHDGGAAISKRDPLDLETIGQEMILSESKL